VVNTANILCLLSHVCPHAVGAQVQEYKFLPKFNINFSIQLPRRLVPETLCKTYADIFS
jgi:hypothetical protein